FNVLTNGHSPPGACGQSFVFEAIWAGASPNANGTNPHDQALKINDNWFQSTDGSLGAIISFVPATGFEIARNYIENGAGCSDSTGQNLAWGMELDLGAGYTGLVHDNIFRLGGPGVAISDNYQNAATITVSNNTCASCPGGTVNINPRSTSTGWS